jgi:predicted nucleic acid-binding protein
MNRVFADAFYFVALLNRADQYHARATAAARESRGEVVTTEWVLAEVADALADSASRRSVAPFIRDLAQDPKVRIVRAGGDWFERGLQLYEQRADKNWPLTDCISFAVMTAEKLTDALTGDHHFRQAGFKALLE